jgi:SAM-dependent methyltransferase
MKIYLTYCITLFLQLFIIFIFLYWYYEKEHLIYGIKCILNPSLNKSGLPTPSQIINKTIQLINTLPKLNYTLIDFGCGSGEFIQKIYKINSIKKIIGIELDSEQAISTKKRFSKIKYISVLNMDMVDYIFEPTPTIFYMYEPLWTLSKNNALPIYHKVMKNISQISSPCYIIYISGKNPILDIEFFKLYPYKIVHYSQAKRFIGCNYIYMLKNI